MLWVFIVSRGISVTGGRGMVDWGMVSVSWGGMAISRGGMAIGWSWMTISWGRVSISRLNWRVCRWVSIGKLSGIGQRDQGENCKDLKNQMITGYSPL